MIQYLFYVQNVWGSILVTTSHLDPAQNILTDPEAHQAYSSEVRMSLFSRVQWLGRETDNSLLSSAYIVNLWSNASTAFVVRRKRKCT
jgi:hypothetical protein